MRKTHEFIHRTAGPNGTTNETVVSEGHARHLLQDHTRNVDRALDRLRGNSWAQLECDGGTLYARPYRGDDEDLE